MTEHDFAEIARKNYSREGYRLALMQWADFAEENGLGYEAGLRGMAAKEPRRPEPASRRGGRYQWLFCLLVAAAGDWPRCELDRKMMPLLKGEPPPEIVGIGDCVGLVYRSFLDAIREAARAYVKVKSPVKANVGGD